MSYSDVRMGPFQTFGQRLDVLLDKAKQVLLSNTAKKIAYTALGIISLVGSGTFAGFTVFACFAIAITTPILFPAVLIASLASLILAAYCGDKTNSYFMKKADRIH